MYTVLLVDDEDDVTQIIMKKVPWEDMGFSVVGLANNGVKALELVEEYQPDVVMTDIRMPYMDGGHRHFKHSPQHHLQHKSHHQKYRYYRSYGRYNPYFTPTDGKMCIRDSP